MHRYVDDRFARGLSSEKFVVGPFGSGKTHFLRQLTELASQRGCVTAEVKLSKDLDFTRRILLYQEIASDIRAPGQTDHGVGGLFAGILQHVRSQVPSRESEDAFVEAWISGIASANLKLDAFGRVAQTALGALARGDDAGFIGAQRWLAGDIHDRQLAKSLPVSAVPTVQQNLYAGHMLLSLFQLIHHARFTGTVVGLDEAEQGFNVDRKHLNRILSMLKSDTDSIADLADGSALVVYALTPDVREEMDRFPALQQRIADPGGVGFLEGNWLATVIDLTIRGDPAEHLRHIAARMVELFTSQEALAPGETAATAHQRAAEIADDVAATELSSSSRRTLVKRVAAFLLGIPVAPDQLEAREF